MTTKSETRHNTVGSLLEEIGADDDFVKDFQAKSQKEFLSSMIQSMRASKGLTQATVAERMGISQSAVSKIEHKNDESITLGELDSYLNSITEGLSIHFGKVPGKAERIKIHAFHIRRLLDELAEDADGVDDIRDGVENFWIEVTANIAALLGRSKAMPPDLIGKLFTGSGDFDFPYEFSSGKDQDDRKVDLCSVE